jgi:hypothetical protein
MKNGYLRESPNSQSVGAQVRQLRAAKPETVFEDTASGACADRAQLRRVLAQLFAGALDARSYQYSCNDD